MKKILDVIKKKEIDVIILFTILVVGCTLFILVDANDEIWNFANSYKMYNGYKIYEDLNVIVTPLFFYIAQIFFKIFGANILAFRIYNIVISLSFFMLIYLIFRNLDILRRRAIFYTTIIIYVFKGMIATGANYNILALIPILIAILLIIKRKENNVLIGLLLSITFMIKQNVYIYFALGIFIYKIIEKDKFTTKFLNLLKIYLVSIIVISVFLINLYMNNNLYNFINYCFWGIGEFGTDNISFNFGAAQYIYISIIAVILTIFIISNKKISELLGENVTENAKKILSIGVPLLLISYPIINYYHATLASVIITIELIYVIENMLIRNMQIRREKEKKAYVIFVLVLIIYLYSGVVITISRIDKGEIIFNKQGPYYGSIIKKEEYDNIETICNYIKEQEKNNMNVIILSYKSNLYMINLNKNNGMFDLAFAGNLGKAGQEGLVSEIKNFKNTLILLQTDLEGVFWQESEVARKHIFDNYKKVGEIKEYDIYYIK